MNSQVICFCRGLSEWSNHGNEDNGIAKSY